MTDNKTVAFDIKYPWKNKRGYRNPFITIWHVDPKKDGTDDSCGRFIRSRHLDQKKINKVIKDFEFEWDHTFCYGKKDDEYDEYESDNSDVEKIIHSCGWFHPNGDPNASVISIVISMFYSAARIFLGHKKAKKYMKDHIWEIIYFSENNIDSLKNSIVRKFEKEHDKKYDKTEREERIREFAHIVSSYIMRDVRPWYRHPRWHLNHWEFQIHPFRKIKRFIFKKCGICGKRFKYNESVGGSWHGDKIYHHDCLRNLECNK